jgi:hypothetical protein
VTTNVLFDHRRMQAWPQENTLSHEPILFCCPLQAVVVAKVAHAGRDEPLSRRA